MTDILLYKIYGRRFSPEALAAQMKERNITYIQVYQYCGYARPQQVKTWMEGRGKPSVSNLMELCRVFRCSVDVLAPKVPMPPAPKTRYKINRCAYRSATT